MKKRKLFFLILVAALLALYFGLFHKNKDLKYIPDNADAVVVIDVKKLARNYLSEAILHPSTWFKESKKEDKNNWLNAGLKIPDFIAFFHLPNEKTNSWYTILPIKNKEKLQEFLKAEKFQLKTGNVYQKASIFLKIVDKILIAGNSETAFNTLEKTFSSPPKNIRSADEFMTEDFGVLAILKDKNIQKYGINLGEDFIEISNSTDFKREVPSTLQPTHFLEANLNQKNLKLFSTLFKNDVFSDENINSVEIVSDLKQVADTIISFDYDENFNEVEKVSIQKIIQPQYSIQLKTSNPNKVWANLKNQRKIDAKNQFTAIPFLPNQIQKEKNGLSIQTKNHPQILKNIPDNYFILKNDALLLSSIKSLSETERRKCNDIDYLFYSNKGDDFVLKLQFKKGNLPLILR